jgi:hypothetical protein
MFWRENNILNFNVESIEVCSMQYSLAKFSSIDFSFKLEKQFEFRKFCYLSEIN